MCELTKKCTKCNIEKSLTQFGKSKRTKDLLQNHCKECKNNQCKQNKSKREPNEIALEGHKVCGTCKIEKKVTDFGENKWCSLGRHSQCKACAVKKSNTWTKENPDKAKRPYKPKPAKPKPIKVSVTEKSCKICGEMKDIDLFIKDSNKCKACRRKEIIENSCTKIVTEKKCGTCGVLQPSANFIKDSSRQDCLCSRCNSCGKVLYEKRKAYIMSRSKVNYKKQSEDPFFRFRYSIRGRIRNTLTIYLKEGKKSRRSQEILGCTFDEFKDYIESQFLPWMSWDNFGDVCGDSPDYNCSWDLDHIIPANWATTNEEIYALNHYSNFQPLCSKVNRWEKAGKIYPVCNRELNITVY